MLSLVGAEYHRMGQRAQHALRIVLCATFMQAYLQLLRREPLNGGPVTTLSNDHCSRCWKHMQYWLNATVNLQWWNRRFLENWSGSSGVCICGVGYSRLKLIAGKDQRQQFFQRKSVSSRMLPCISIETQSP